ncbi:hypothetical protein SteCoe_20900 [Stentor coeruleus]|uniref:ELMO domain-containing protein n=1 Tax=Stentor coeruleus TaxID=5963 RepID=A0A1R2BQR8_9CILI|nr:hypothetical protein SteCoe_20900 [Stentor coeruleus]
MADDDNIDFYPNSCWGCCCKRKRFALTHQEIESLQFLRLKSRVKFDVTNTLHQEELKALWNLSFENPPELITDQWVTIGFQGPDPSTDFRGGGLYSLQQLIFFAKNFPEKYIVYKNAEYSFAICSVNLTYFFLYYFQLLPKKALGTSDCRRAPPHIMKVFARLNAQDQSTLDEIHSIAAMKMHEKWQEMKQKPGITVMNFMQALVFSTFFIENLLSHNPGSLFDLKRLSV